MKEGYAERLEKELTEWESKLEALREKGASGILEDLKAKRDELRAKLGELRTSSHERWDVVKMGVDSAWAELRSAFETALAAKPNETKMDRNAA